MKLTAIIFSFFLCMNFSFSQEPQHEKYFVEYENLLDETKTNAQIILKVAKYECSEDVFGEVHYIYKEDSLKLIKHVFKQGYYQEYTKEYYYVKADSLQLHTIFKELIVFNTNNYENSYGTSVSGAEKFMELIEERRVINSSNSEMNCYKRSYGQKVSEWDQDFFNTLEFSEAECTDYFDDITDKFKLLLKVERNYLNSSRKKPPCIFHIW